MRTVWTRPVTSRTRTLTTIAYTTSKGTDMNRPRKTPYELFEDFVRELSVAIRACADWNLHDALRPMHQPSQSIDFGGAFTCPEIESLLAFVKGIAVTQTDDIVHAVESVLLVQHALTEEPGDWHYLGGDDVEA